VTEVDETDAAEPGPALPRRDFLRAAAAGGLGAAALVTPLAAPRAQPTASAAPDAPPPAAPQTSAPVATPAADVLVFFTPAETTLVTGLVDRLFPADALSPAASELGVVFFLDRQLAGSYGEGAKTYRSGPWAEGTPNQGYQLALTPAEFYRQAFAELAAALDRMKPGATFESLSPVEQDRVLSGLEAGTFALASVPGRAFFETLRTNVIEGLFSDPAYGGNRGMKGWSLIGFPGVQLDWTEGFEQWRDKRVDLAPKSIADNL
jgi:gluconate 2-dehydrogenase gamma chain